ARHRRDDDRRGRRRPAAAAHAQPVRADRDDDRLHRAGEPGRRPRRHPRVPHHLRRRHGAVPDDLRPQHHQQLGAAPLPRGVRMSGTPAARLWGDRLLQSMALIVLALALVALGALLYDIVSDGAGRLSWQFLTSPPSSRASQAGIYLALIGSIWIMALTALL